MSPACTTFQSPPDAVWKVLTDPVVIAGCLPGCDRLEPIGEDKYRAAMTLAVAAVSGNYTGTVSMLDRGPAALLPARRRGIGHAGIREWRSDDRADCGGQWDHSARDRTGQRRRGHRARRPAAARIGVKDDDGPVLWVFAGKNRFRLKADTAGRNSAVSWL